MDNDTLKEIVPTLAVRVKLLAYIKKNRNFESTSNASTVLLHTSTLSSNDLSCDIQSFKKQKVDPISPLIFPGFKDVEQYLNDSRFGRHLLEAYKQNGDFTHKERSKLVHIIADSLCESTTSVSNENYSLITDHLVKLFLKELRSTYFIPPAGAKNIATGKLVERFRNQRKLCRKTEQFLDTSTTSVESDQTEDNYNSELEWLMNSAEPWHKVLNFWEITKTKRCCDTSIHCYFKNYPALTSPLGYNLVGFE